MSIKDMTDLIYAYDAYITINKALFGNAILLGFHEGNWGAISRMFNVIERNVTEELKKDDYKAAWEMFFARPFCRKMQNENVGCCNTVL